MKSHYQKLEWMYLHAAPINKFFKPAISITEGQAIITMESSAKFFHAANAVHGSVYFKMLDDASFFAVNSLVSDAFVLTTNYNVNLLRPVVYGELRAEGEVIFNARNNFVAEAKLYNKNNDLIATGSGSFVKSKIALDERVGYKEAD